MKGICFLLSAFCLLLSAFCRLPAAFGERPRGPRTHPPGASLQATSSAEFASKASVGSRDG